jgi:hypothetical protein
MTSQSTTHEKQLNTRVSASVHEEFTQIAAREHRSAAKELRRMVEERVKQERKSKFTVIDGGEAA